MSPPVPVTLSATLAADAELDRRRRAGEEVVPLASGEIGLPVLPELRERLGRAADRNAYGPVTGSAALRTAAAGYWQRRAWRPTPAWWSAARAASRCCSPSCWPSAAIPSCRSPPG
ncbi:hypothetical protein [Actinacidiphila yeochonensis]|uniref:hypothetical protein n=1 Tax=Actinacidiphila yeochonensis TaxID=89050 RepID=UPI002AFF5027|nr:hypothetical protein [Actinacidiphila yeochonensis]